MHHKLTRRLVEVCPQCCQSVASSSTRLVQDSCGHAKCRICLLQENTGCLLCATKQGQQDAAASDSAVSATEAQPRKSVITSLAIQIAEQEEKQVKLPSPPIVDKETCQIIKQTLEKDILFPTEIVKRSTGNFYHLKRIFSERFFNEEGKSKEHKSCETESEWSRTDNEKVDKKNVDENVEKKGEEENVEKTAGWRVPSHVEVRYYCTVHKVSFRQKHNILRNHMTCTLSSDKIELKKNHCVKCKVCGKAYKAVGKLNRHMRTHTKVTKFQCQECNKYCVDNYDLKTHMRCHTREKPFVCCYCDKTFSSKYYHLRHEKKHRNEKDVVCNSCGFKFLTLAELKSHSVVHSTVKAHTCNICQKEFSLRRTLMRHKSTHGTKPSKLECNECQSTFRRKDNLERHIKNTHTSTKDNSDEKDKTGVKG